MITLLRIAALPVPTQTMFGFDSETSIDPIEPVAICPSQIGVQSVAAVLGLPDAAAGGAHVVGAGLAAHAGDRGHASAARGPDVPPAEILIELRLDGVRRSRLRGDRRCGGVPRDERWRDNGGHDQNEEQETDGLETAEITVAHSGSIALPHVRSARLWQDRST